jgi:hypothetical protein
MSENPVALVEDGYLVRAVALEADSRVQDD